MPDLTLDFAQAVRLTFSKSRLRDIFARLLWISGATRPRRALRSSLTIVTFHRVLPPTVLASYPLPGLAVTPRELQDFIVFFKEHFDIATVKQQLQTLQHSIPDRPLLSITFDDGQLDNFLHARPVLDALSVRATFYVPTDSIGQQKPLWHDAIAYTEVALRARPDQRRALGIPEAERADVFVELAKTWSPEKRRDFIHEAEIRLGSVAPAWDGFMSAQQLRRLSDEGHEIGSHSASHALLTQLDDIGLRQELQRSKQVLENHLGCLVESFCYPNGSHDRRVVSATREAGYENAVTTWWGSNRPGADLFTLHRCDMNAGHSKNASGELSHPRLGWRLSGLHPGLS